MGTYSEKAILDAMNFYGEEVDVDINLDGVDDEAKLEELFAELHFLKEDSIHINNQDHLGETVMNVVWEQLRNHIASTAGEDFIKDNGDLKLNLSNAAHIQTPENFAKGKLATHNRMSKEQLEKNYDRYKNTSHKKFRKEYINPGMDATLKRAGELKKDGVDTVKDIYTGRQISTSTKLENGKNNPNAAQREHVDPSAQGYENPSLQMGYDNEKFAAIINDPNNLQGYTTAERNNRKSDKTIEEMSEKDKTKHFEKAKEKADEHIKQKEKEAQERLKQEGRMTQKEEFYRMGKHALRSAFMAVLATLLKEIIGKLVLWLKSTNKNLKSLVESVKAAIKSFINKLKQLLVNTTDSLLTTIATSIIGPVISTIRKTITLLKQGWQSLKEAVQFLRKPENKGKPLSYLLPKVGIIVVSGLSGIGAIALGEFIEKALLNIPFLAIEMPLLGTPANLIGTLMGAIVCGVIGAIAINLINKYVAKQQKSDNLSSQINTQMKINEVQQTILEGKMKNLYESTKRTSDDMCNRRTVIYGEFTEIMQETKDGWEELNVTMDDDELNKLLQ